MTTTSCDVVVVGAGSAGIAAAIAAARNSARVCLLERDATVGGNATNAMVGTICGLARCGRDAPRSPSFDNPGFAAEFSRRIASASSTSLTINDDGLAYLPYHEEALRSVMRDMLKETRGVSLVTQASLSSISRSASDRDYQIVLAGDETKELRTKAIIDSTGNAFVSKLLGLPVIAPKTPQAASLIFQLERLPNLDERSLGFTLRKILIEASREGIIPHHLTYVSVIPGSTRNATALCKLATPSPPDPTNTTVGWEEAHKAVHEIVQTLRAQSKSFEYIQHSYTAPRLGVRSGAMGVGEERLSEEAVRLSERHING